MTAAAPVPASAPRVKAVGSDDPAASDPWVDARHIEIADSLVQPPVPEDAPRPTSPAPDLTRPDPLPPVVIDTIRVEVAAPAAAPPDPFGGLRHHADGITRWGRS